MAKRSSFGPLVLVMAAASCSFYVACGDDDVIIGQGGGGGSGGGAGDAGVGGTGGGGTGGSGTGGTAGLGGNGGNAGTTDVPGDAGPDAEPDGGDAATSNN
jgi:hypothetical protein